MSKVKNFMKAAQENLSIENIRKNLSTGGRNTAMAIALAAAIGTAKIGSDIHTTIRDVDSKSKKEMNITDEREAILSESVKTGNDFIQSLSQSDKQELSELLKEVNITKGIDDLTNEDIMHILEDKVKPMLQDQSDNAKRSIWLSLGSLLVGLILLNALRNKYEKHAKITMSAEFKEYIAKNLENESKINGLFAAVSMDGSIDMTTLEQENIDKQEKINKGMNEFKTRSELLSAEKINLSSDQINGLLSMIEKETAFNTLYTQIDAIIKTIDTQESKINSLDVEIKGTIGLKEKGSLLKDKINLDKDVKLQYEKITKTLTTNSKLLVDFFENKQQELNNNLTSEQENYNRKIGELANMENILSDWDQHKDQIVRDLFPGEDANDYQNTVNQLTQEIEGLEKELENNNTNNTNNRNNKDTYEKLSQECIIGNLLTEDEIKNLETTMNTLNTTIEDTKKIEYKSGEDTVLLSDCVKKDDKNTYISTELFSTLDDPSQLELIEKANIIEQAEVKIAFLETLKELLTQASGDIIETTHTEATIKALIKQRDNALINVELSADINTNLATIRQAFTNTIDELRGEKNYTMEEVYDTFITNIQEIDPDRSLPSPTGSGIQGIQDSIIERTKSIGREFFAQTAEVSAGIAGGYHAFRGLLNNLPDIFAQNTPSMLGAGVISILGGLSIYVTTDAIRKAFQKQYRDSLSKNHSQYITREISIIKALADNPLVKKLKHGALGVYALAALTTYADVMGSGATWAAKAKKTEIFTVLDKESNMVQSNTVKFTNTIDSLFLSSQTKALETVTMEINAGGAGPLTGEKLALIYGKDMTKWPGSLSDFVYSKKISGFDEGVNNISGENSGQLLVIQESYNNKLNEIKKKMFIVINNENVPLNQVPRFIKNMETGLSDVNISKDINDIKQQYEVKIQEVISELIELTKTTNLQLEQLESDLSTVGGQPITFKKFDTQALETLINLSLSEPVKKFLEAMGQTNPFFDNMKEMIATVMNIPAGTREATLLWIMIVSILPVWIIAAERLRRGRNQSRKGTPDQQDATIILAQDAYDALQNIIQKSGNEELISLLSGPSYKAVSKLLNIPDDALTKFGKSRTEMGRRGKPRWDRQEALYNNEVKSAKIKINSLIQTHKAILDQELGSFIDHSQLQDTIVNPETKVLYTDRFIRTNAHTEETLCTAIADMMSKSPTFTNLISTQYNTYASINTLGSTTSTTSPETAIINESNVTPTEAKGKGFLNTIKSGSRNLFETFKNTFKKKK